MTWHNNRILSVTLIPPFKAYINTQFVFWVKTVPFLKAHFLHSVFRNDNDIWLCKPVSGI